MWCAVSKPQGARAALQLVVRACVGYHATSCIALLRLLAKSSLRAVLQSVINLCRAAGGKAVTFVLSLHFWLHYPAKLACPSSGSITEQHNSGSRPLLPTCCLGGHRCSTPKHSNLAFCCPDSHPAT